MRKVVQHYRGSGSTGNEANSPSADDLMTGEIGINYGDGTERMFIKNESSKIVSFVSKDYIEEKFQTKVPVLSESVTSLESNTFYSLGELSSSTTFTLVSPSDGSVYNEYMGQFSVSSTDITITWPSTITWASTLSYKTGVTYEFSIVNNLGLMVAFS
jgi:hypothetical protein